MEFEAVIGLEVHIQLSTATKIFCSCRNKFGDAPNTNVCPVCLGFPGSLPVLNKKAYDFAARAGLALNCRINKKCKFDRKNYYYPDLPKAYQISQFDLPVAEGGCIKFYADGKIKTVGITRVHLEEDAGKLVHSSDDFSKSAFSYADYNRCGTPLIEIVTEPDIHSPEEAYGYLNALKTTMLYLDISDCNMEEGSLRCDANISVRPKGQKELGVKAELKNMNSFKFIKQGLEYEIKRQIKVLEEGGKIIQETRLFDSASGRTKSMRTKEEAHDYRYFPDPDLIPVETDDDFINKIKQEMPELPFDKRERFINEYGVNESAADFLTADKSASDYFEKCASAYGGNSKTVVNWLTGHLTSVLNAEKKSFAECPLKPEGLVKLIKLIDSGKISNNMAKDIFDEVYNGGDAEEIIEKKGLVQISDASSIEKIADDVINENPGPVNDFKGGKEKAIGFLIGQVMKKTKGKVNAQKASEILKEKLK